MSRTPTISVVIPTYREAENIEAVVRGVCAALRPQWSTFEVLIVDDDSRDGSQELVERLATNLPVRIILRGADRGLSQAVLEGVGHARGEYVVVMDADLSHPADRIPAMIERLTSGTNDFVIGSRYIEDGGVDDSWTLFRRLNSRVATLLARPLVDIKDPMAGFMAFARADMPPRDQLSPIGYKIGLELLVKGGFERPGEIPIQFLDRQHGTSKLSWREQVRYLQHLSRLYRYRFPARTELVQFGMVGVSGFVVDLTIYLSLQALLGVQHLTTRALSFWGAATWNWFWNRKLTFADRQRTRKRIQWPAFLLSSLLGFVLNWGTYFTLTSNIPYFAHGAARILALFLGVIVGMGLNFLFARAFVFVRNPVDAAS